MKEVTFEAIKEAIAELPEEQRAALYWEFFYHLQALPHQDRTRKETIERLRQRARPLPPEFKFDRLEVHER